MKDLCKWENITHQYFQIKLNQFNSFPVFLQVGCISFSCIFIFFTVDAWFSPFYFKPYQLISYIFCILLLSSWLAHQAIFRLVKSPFLWDCSTTENVALRSCRDLSIKDICESELSNLAKSAAEFVINYWCDESNNNEEFVKEIHNQIEDIFYTLSEKLSGIKVEYFVRNLILIVHNHLRSYMKTVNLSSLSASHQKFSFNHPVSKGDISLELYLDSLSHAVMKEFIPGSIQDCSAVFDLSCAAFSSQVLIKCVENLSQPGLVLQSIIKILESVDETVETVDSTDATIHSLIETSPHQDISNISESSKINQDPQDRSSPQTHEEEEDRENIVKPNSNICARNGSPVLAGSLSCSNLTSSTQPKPESSWVKTGLCSSLSTATAPLLPSQYPVDPLFVEDSSQFNSIQKPSSLPLIADSPTISSNDVIEGLDPEQNNGLLVDADVSPVYEDVEDFATAIAKLRSLLEQRNSTNDVSCAKNYVSSPITGDTSSGGETESSFEELTEASELPNDSRIFFGIKIPKTEICTLPGEGQHSFYCIVYDGIYTAVSTASFNNAEEVPKDSRLVLKNRTVRRRFCQFMQLHAQLEASEDPSVSLAIRSVRGPSKWLNLPFSRLDQNTVTHRQVFLERYMQQLCTSPSIGMSVELRNFLDYELHLNEMSVAPSNAALQRVPFFAKTVSGVLQSIKTALPLPIPGFDNDQSRPVQLVPLPLPSPLTAHINPPEREGKFSQSTSSVDEVDSPLVPLFACRLAFASEESKLEQLLSNWNHMDCRVESAYEAFESHLWRSEQNIQLSQDMAAQDTKPPLYTEIVAADKTCDIKPKGGWDRFDDELPLASSLINLFVECLNLQETWLTKAPVPLFLKIAFGKQIENFFQESLLELNNPDRLAENLHSFRQKLGANSSNPVFMVDDKDINELVREAIHLLNKKLPGLVVRIIGEDLCADVLKMTFSCLTDAQLNRDLALTLLDFIFLQICATLSSVDRIK